MQACKMHKQNNKRTKTYKHVLCRCSGGVACLTNENYKMKESMLCKKKNADREKNTSKARYAENMSSVIT